MTVACPSAKSCWAFGYYYAAPLKPTVAGYLMALHWNGAGWKLVWTSAPYLGADSSANFRLGIECTSASNCWAVGYSSRSPLDNHPIIVRWDGHKWASVEPPKFENASLYGVGCASAQDCWAVGNTGTFYENEGTHSLVLHWNGVQWSNVPTPGGSNDTLASVACASPSSCWAVGNDQVGNVGNNIINLALRWNGSSWSDF